MAPASSAKVRAPHRAKSPPVAQTAISGRGPGSLSAMPAGDRKMPEPIVVPTRTAIALQSPKRRGRAVATPESGPASVAGWAAVEETEAEVIALW